ncbi:MAG: hypothetical protein N3A63_03295 [Bacteroidetes bacterium]|nr:hypothetical protein [Bacteroidota bacterium]
MKRWVIMSLVVPHMLLAQVETIFPVIEGFQRKIFPEVYTPETLFELIDGAADMFLTYDFEELTLAEYSNDRISYIRVEVYKHRDEANAFGAYAQERNPEATFVPLGCEGYILDGTVNFCAGQYYVKLVTNDQGPTVQSALMRIAERVAEGVARHKVEKPRMFTYFPSDHRKSHAEYYVNRDFLGYSVFQKAYVVPYTHSNLFVMEYSTAEHARNALKSYSQILKVNVPLENGAVVHDPNEGRLLFYCVDKYIVGAKEIQNEQGTHQALRKVQEALRATSE